MSQSAGAYSPDRNIDRETACWITTATGEEIQHGTIRHDDSLPAPGWLLFEQNTGAPVDTSVAGFEFVDCTSSDCCPIMLGEGCWDDGTDSGVWVSIRDGDGVVTLTNPATGAVIDPADVVECSGRTNHTQIRNVGASQNFVIPTADPLVSWSVRVITQPVSIDVNASGAIALAPAEALSSTAEAGGTLDDVVTVTTGAGGVAHVLFTSRV